jgi:E3 ubiquitin-protein ligase UBR3
MSICAQCFQHGNHEGHNYNMFKSQAGGACDCGDSSVMHEFGFCRFHGENRPKTRVVPRELICCAELLIPHLLKVFIRALRMSTVSGKGKFIYFELIKKKVENF